MRMEEMGVITCWDFVGAISRLVTRAFMVKGRLMGGFDHRKLIVNGCFW